MLEGRMSARLRLRVSRDGRGGFQIHDLLFGTQE